MKSAFARSAGLLTLLALFGFGCGPTSGDGSALGDSSRLPGTGRVATSLCDHPYYPLRTGYRVDYRNEFTDPDPANTNNRRLITGYGVSVESVSGNTATLKYSFQTERPIEATQTIRCLPEGLAADGYIDVTALSGGRGAAVRTQESTGLLLPRDLHVGSQWNQSYSFTTQIPGNRLQTQPIDVRGLVEIDHSAILETDLSTLTGTSTALLVESHVVSTMQFPGAAPVIIRSFGQDWWVRGKGLVRANYNITGGNLSVSEARSITVP